MALRGPERRKNVPGVPYQTPSSRATGYSLLGHAAGPLDLVFGIKPLCLNGIHGVDSV